MVPRVVVIGGDAAGMTAASAVRRLAGEAEVVVLERGFDTSYSACGVPYWVAGDVAECDDLVARTPEEHREKGIDLRLGATAEVVDVDARTVTYRDADGTHALGWDRLLLATGADSVRPDLPGIDAEGIHTIKDLDDGRRVIDHLAAGVRHAVVVGSGYIGLEMAEALHARGVDTTVVERDTTPLPIVEDAIGELDADAVRNTRTQLSTSPGKKIDQN